MLSDEGLTPQATAVMRDNQAQLVPDVATYSDWFDLADEKRRRTAVGTIRYQTVTAQTDNPTWAHFMGEDGDLLSVEQLRRESAQERAERLTRINAMLGERERAFRQVATYGTI